MSFVSLSLKLYRMLVDSYSGPQQRREKRTRLSPHQGCSASTVCCPIPTKASQDCVEPLVAVVTFIIELIRGVHAVNEEWYQKSYPCLSNRIMVNI